MIITSIKQQVKNPDRASLFIDGKYSFSLSLNELVTEKLKINQEIDEPGLKRLKKISDDGKLKARALEWVLNRPRSTRELKNYLYHRKTEDETAEAIIDYLQSRGYVDDRSFAIWLIDVRTRSGKSSRMIENELQKKGVKREIINDLLSSDSSGEVDKIVTIINKKSKISRYKNDEIRLKQYLLRQGFNYEDIKTALTKQQL